MALLLCFTSLAVNVSDLPRLDVPGERTLKLDIGKYILYAEGDDDTAYAGLQCTVRDATGAALPVNESKYGPSYDTLSHSGRSVFDVFVKHPGDHTLACTMREGSHGTIAVGRNLGITIMIGVVSLIVGIAGSLLAAFLIHRKRARVAASPKTTT